MLRRPLPRRFADHACAKEGYDEWTLWYIELVLLLVGGVLTVLAGVRIAGGNKITNFIVTKIMPNPAFRSLFSGPVSFKTISRSSTFEDERVADTAFEGRYERAALVQSGLVDCRDDNYGCSYLHGHGSALLRRGVCRPGRQPDRSPGDMPASGTLLPCGVSALFFDHHAVTSTVPLPTGEATPSRWLERDPARVQARVG